MKVLLDECIHVKLTGLLPGHTVQTVTQARWEGVKNGELLRLASKNFEVFISVDRNLAFQQNPKTLPLPIIIIHTPSTQLKELKKHIPSVLNILQKPLSNNFYHVGV